MKALLQRVTEARVLIAGGEVAAIRQGVLVLLGIERDDLADAVQRLAARVLQLRIFPDADKPMNRSLLDVQGEVLLVPQFTLAADTSRGRRPGFSNAAPPDHARLLFDAFVAACRKECSQVQCGQFGADMQVHLVNDGPVTFMLQA